MWQRIWKSSKAWTRLNPKTQTFWALTLRRYAPGLTHKILPVAPLVSVVLITMIVASIIGASRAAIIESGSLLIGAVFALHVCGFGLGYILTRFLSPNVISARTVAIEVGMQNSGLGVVLAGANFVNPLVAVPSAISSLFHSLIGSVLAGYWRASSARNTVPSETVVLEAEVAGKK